MEEAVSKVSIIVPVYGVEAYLEECVDSLLAQRYEDLEILLIDDASPDRCPEICDAYGRTDHRVRVIHKPNGGAASARNAGLNAATGELICFVDSDDAVEPGYVEHLVRTLEDHGADAAVCGFGFWTRGKFEVQKMMTEPGEYSAEAYLRRFLHDWHCSLLWNKIFRREVIGQLRMEEGHRIDDEYFTYRVCMNCRSVAVSDRCLYRYRLRASSVMQDMAAVQEKIMLDRIGYVTVRYQHIAEKMPALEAEFFADTLDTLTRYWNHSKGMPEVRKQIRSWGGSHLNRLRSINIPLRRKLGYLYCLYLKKPALTAEVNSIQMDAQEYFD